MMKVPAVSSAASPAPTAPAVATSPASTVFTRRGSVFALALLCCLLWGSSFPAIKSGYALLGIAGDDIPSKLVFAGWRFLAAGGLLLAWAAATGRRLGGWPPSVWRQLVVLGLVQTSVQYVFFYIGLAHTTGVKASIMNATSTFFSVLMAHWLYHNDRLTWRKSLGCAAGFVGVMVVNLGGSGGGLAGALTGVEFTLLGEGFVVIAALVLAVGGIYGKRISQHMDPVAMTGWQLVVGGGVLLAAGYALGGSLGHITPASSALLGYMAVLSALAISIWSLLLQHNRVSLITAFNFMIPVFGALLSALFLGESILEWRNAAALALVCWGIWLVTTQASGALKRRGD